MSERRDYAEYALRTTPRGACPATVRLAAEADLEPAVALSLTVSTAPAQEWRDRLRHDVVLPDRALVVARVEDAVVGYARAGHVLPGPGDTAPEGDYLVGLVVAPAWRRRGVGAALVLGVRAHLRAPDDVLWSTYDEDNLASAQLHASLGFQVVRRGHVGFPGQPPGSRLALVQQPPPASR